MDVAISWPVKPVSAMSTSLTAIDSSINIQSPFLLFPALKNGQKDIENIIEPHRNASDAKKKANIWSSASNVT